MSDDSGTFWFYAIVIALIVGVPATWHSKWRYALQYNLSPSLISIDAQPHDCDFLSAPLGEKHCDYRRIVAPDLDDNGKVVSLDISWEKVDSP